jgi:hypothetical protein
MGLVEYQSIASLRDVAHDGRLCTFTTQQELEIPSSGSGATPVRATGTVRKRQAVRLVHHVQNHTSRDTLSTSHAARRAAVLDQPSSLRPHCKKSLNCGFNGEAIFFHWKTDYDLCKHFAVTCRKLAERLY